MNTRRHTCGARGDDACARTVLATGQHLRAVLQALIAIVLALLTVMPACAQGAEAYAVPHLFALPTATTTRQFGMGGVSTCLEDVGFPNPAFAGMLDMSRGACASPAPTSTVVSN